MPAESRKSVLGIFEDDLESLLKGPKQVQQSGAIILDKYLSRQYQNLDIPAPPAQLGGETHEFVTTSSAMDRERPLNGPPQQQSAVEEEERVFLQAMRDYEIHAPEKYRTGIKVDETHTMAQVWCVLDKAATEYENAHHRPGFWGQLRAAFMRLGTHEVAFEGWLGLLPSESQYFSIFCGGIKLILQAAIRMQNIHDTVLSHLAKIPTCISSAQRVLQIFSSSQELRSLSNSLYVATLKTLGLILAHTREKALKQILKAIFAHRNYEGSINASVEDMRQCIEKFNEEATICQANLARDIKQVVHASAEKLADMKEKQQLACREQSRVKDLVKAMEHELQIWRQENKESTEKVLKAVKMLTEMFQSNPDLKEVARLMTTKQSQGDRVCRCRCKHRVPCQDATDWDAKPTAKKRARNAVSRKHLRGFMRKLDYDRQQTRIDVINNYRIIWNLSGEDQERCLHVINSLQLVAWIQDPISSALIVNGNSKMIQRRSPWSFISAKLASTLVKLRKILDEKKGLPSRDVAPKSSPLVVALTFFCGEHIDSDDKTNTPCSIINSLLGQLLSYKHVDVTKIDKLGDFDKADLDAMLVRFEKALEQLPPTTLVFCIIDSLSFYLTNMSMSKESNRLLKWLIKLTQRRRREQDISGLCIFKVLLTAPVQFPGPIMDKLREDEILNVPAILSNTGGYTASKWKLALSGTTEKWEDLASP